MLVECQLQLKSLVVEAGDLDLIEKKKLTVVSFVDSIHDMSEGFLTYDNRQDITALLQYVASLKIGRASYWRTLLRR